MNETSPIVTSDDQITLEVVERIKRSLPPLQGKYPTGIDQVHQIEDALETIGKPATALWLSGRIYSLLLHYYVADLPPAAAKAIAMDWTRELQDFPAWAIDAACAWWVSRHNPKRAKKPQPGDISERAFVDAGLISVGRKQIENYQKWGNKPPSYLT